MNNNPFNCPCYHEIAEIHIRLPANVTSKNLKVNITNTSINIYSQLNGERQEILCGQFSEKCKALDVVWTIAGGNKLNINLEKTKEIWWKKLLDREPDIDVKKIDCSRPIDELSEETQAQINQIQFDEQQKMKGMFVFTNSNCVHQKWDERRLSNIPIHCIVIGELTSEQIKQQEMLRKAWDAEGSPFKGQPFDPNIVQFQN